MEKTDGDEAMTGDPSRHDDGLRDASAPRPGGAIVERLPAAFGAVGPAVAALGHAAGGPHGTASIWVWYATGAGAVVAALLGYAGDRLVSTLRPPRRRDGGRLRWAADESWMRLSPEARREVFSRRTLAKAVAVGLAAIAAGLLLMSLLPSALATPTGSSPSDPAAGPGAPPEAPSAAVPPALDHDAEDPRADEPAPAPDDAAEDPLGWADTEVGS